MSAASWTWTIALPRTPREFGQRDKFDNRIRHLFTYTSVLPDNDGLRRREAPLMEYLESTYRQPLLFAPGTDISCQSMGILVLGEIVERITGQRLPAFLRTELFEPMGMDSTSPGWRDDLAAVSCPRRQQTTPRASESGARTTGGASAPPGVGLTPLWRIWCACSGSCWTGV